MNHADDEKAFCPALNINSAKTRMGRIKTAFLAIDIICEYIYKSCKAWTLILIQNRLSGIDFCWQTSDFCVAHVSGLNWLCRFLKGHEKTAKKEASEFPHECSHISSLVFPANIAPSPCPPLLTVVFNDSSPSNCSLPFPGRLCSSRMTRHKDLHCVSHASFYHSGRPAMRCHAT